MGSGGSSTAILDNLEFLGPCPCVFNLKEKDYSKIQISSLVIINKNDPLIDTNCRSTWLGPITFLAQSTQPNPESLNLQYNLKYKTWMILTNGMIPLMPLIHATNQKHVLEFFFLFNFLVSIKKYRKNYIFLMFKTVSYTKVLNKIKILTKKKFQS